MSDGPALLETIGVRSGRAPLWPLHLERLHRSAAALGLTVPEGLARPSGGGDHVVRYTIAGGQVYVAGRPLEAVEAIRLAWSTVEHTGYPDKTDQRNWLDDARLLATRAGADDALLRRHDGLVVEATLWAVGWWEEDALCFPALTLGGLRSVARRRLGELVPIREARVGPDALAGRALIVCNAARGVVEVSHLDGAILPRDPRTAELRLRFWDRPDA